MSGGERWSRRGLLRKSLLLGRRPAEGITPPPEFPPAAEPAAEPDSDPEPASPEEIRRRIEAEPGCRELLLRLLEFCAAPRAESEIYCWMRPFPEMRTAFYRPETLFLWMVEAGAIARLPGGEYWQTTPEGKQLLLS